MKEVWKEIPTYNYLVSNIGNVYSFATDRILKPNIDRNGYARVPLYRNRIKQYIQIHRLVAEAFIENPNNLPCINHKNNIRNDNRVENLEWCTYSYNNKYAYDKGKKNKMFGNDNGKSIPVLQLDKNGNIIKEFESMCICAKELKLQQSCISLVCNGIRKSTGGFIFRRKDDIYVK